MGCSDELATHGWGMLENLIFLGQMLVELQYRRYVPASACFRGISVNSFRKMEHDCGNREQGTVISGSLNKVRFT